MKRLSSSAIDNAQPQRRSDPERNMFFGSHFARSCDLRFMIRRCGYDQFHGG
jgi:hypothetical protein